MVPYRPYFFFSELRCCLRKGSHTFSPKKAAENTLDSQCESRTWKAFYSALLLIKTMIQFNCSLLTHLHFSTVPGYPVTGLISILPKCPICYHHPRISVVRNAYIDRLLTDIATNLTSSSFFSPSTSPFPIGFSSTASMTPSSCTSFSLSPLKKAACLSLFCFS